MGRRCYGLEMGEVPFYSVGKNKDILFESKIEGIFETLYDNRVLMWKEIEKDLTAFRSGNNDELFIIKVLIFKDIVDGIMCKMFTYLKAETKYYRFKNYDMLTPEEFHKYLLDSKNKCYSEVSQNPYKTYAEYLEKPLKKYEFKCKYEKAMLKKFFLLDAYEMLYDNKSTYEFIHQYNNIDISETIYELAEIYSEKTYNKRYHENGDYITNYLNDVNKYN